MENIEIFMDNPICYMYSIKKECKDILKLIKKYKYDCVYLYELFIKLFNLNSSDYLILQKYFIKNKKIYLI